MNEWCWIGVYVILTGVMCWAVHRLAQLSRDVYENAKDECDDTVW